MSFQMGIVRLFVQVQLTVLLEFVFPKEWGCVYHPVLIQVIALTWVPVGCVTSESSQKVDGLSFV